MYFVLSYGCPAVADLGSISIPTTDFTEYNYDSKVDLLRYEIERIFTFPAMAAIRDSSNQATIDKFSSLENGWDSYTAPAPCKVAIERAKEMVATLERSGQVIEHVGPSVIGGVGITVAQDETEYAIEFRNSGKVVVTEIHEDDGVTVHEMAVSPMLLSTVLSLLNKDVA